MKKLKSKQTLYYKIIFKIFFQTPIFIFLFFLFSKQRRCGVGVPCTRAIVVVSSSQVSSLSPLPHFTCHLHYHQFLHMFTCQLHYHRFCFPWIWGAANTEFLFLYTILTRSSMLIITSASNIFNSWNFLSFKY